VFYDKWTDFLSTLNLEQVYSLSNILLSLLILMFLFNIIIIYYGDLLIKYLLLEEKYPRLAKIINLRRKVLNFNIFINFLIIFILLIILIFINVSYLYYS
jgi:hypothetical protein